MFIRLTVLKSTTFLDSTRQSLSVEPRSLCGLSVEYLNRLTGNRLFVE
jgi:hypothetical protein